MQDAALNADDLDLLLARYELPGEKSEEQFRPPWTWAALTTEEAAALGRLCDTYAATYNRVYVVDRSEIVPPCWRQHLGLAHDLAVQVWHYYAAHLHTKATPNMAGDFHQRYLPAFRNRVEGWLGRNPSECQRGAHVTNWRKEIADRLDEQHQASQNSSTDQDSVDTLAALHFGFSDRTQTS